MTLYYYKTTLAKKMSRTNFNVSLCIISFTIALSYSNRALCNDLNNNIQELHKQYANNIKYSESKLLKIILSEKIFLKVFSYQNPNENIFQLNNLSLNRGQAKELLIELTSHYKLIFEELKNNRTDNTNLINLFNEGERLSLELTQMLQTLMDSNNPGVELNLFPKSVVQIEEIIKRVNNVLFKKQPRASKRKAELISEVPLTPSPNDDDVLSIQKPVDIENPKRKKKHTDALVKNDVSQQSSQKNIDEGPSTKISTQDENKQLDAPISLKSNINTVELKNSGPAKTDPIKPIEFTGLNAQNPNPEIPSTVLEKEMSGPNKPESKSMPNSVQTKETSINEPIRIWSESRITGPIQ